MSSPLPFRLPFAASADSNEYVAALRKKRALIGAFTNALFDWIEPISRQGSGEVTIALFNLLVNDIDLQIEAVLKPPAGRTMVYAPSPDELVAAQENVEAFQSQVDALEAYGDKVPEEMRPLAMMAMPMLKQQLRQAIEFRDRLQKTLEAIADDNPAPQPAADPPVRTLYDITDPRRPEYCPPPTPRPPDAA